MAAERTKIALDLSCLLPQPLTGVGYYTLHLTRALFSGYADEFDFRILASSARSSFDILNEFSGACTRVNTLRWPTRLKIPMWTRLNWPPIERFAGDVDIAHEAFHLLPATRMAKRMTTVFDLSNLSLPESHTDESTRRNVHMLRHAVKNADALVAISESCRNDLIEYLDAPPEKVHVVYGGVFLEEFDGEVDHERLASVKEKHGIQGNYFIHLGTLEPRKNLVRLVEAYARVKARHADCPRLVLVGRAGWKFEPVFEAINSLGLQNDVVHTGYTSREEAVTLLKGAYACTYPSLYEGFGLPVLEAMAAGTPVLTSNVSSLPEVIGDTGIQINPENTEEIEAGMVELIVDPAAAQERAQRASERAIQFTWDKSAGQLVQLYRALAR